MTIPATYWLSQAGVTLRGQVDTTWPDRDKASDGWIGDASHQATVSDHNPCWTCVGDHYGVVRAIDVDTDLNPKDPKAMQRLAAQLIAYAREGKDHGRLSYVIYDRLIASGTYEDAYWVWRPYTSTDDPHTSHMHVSFLPYGDLHGGSFYLPIFSVQKRRRLARLIQKINDQIETLRRKRARNNKKLAKLKEVYA